MRVRSTVGAFVAYNTRSDALRIPSDDPVEAVVAKTRSCGST
jgi:hypothetical protein